jgi:hypothetical protein
MNSHPLIETALGETEQNFIDFVERHARARDLPSDTFSLRISTSIDDDAYKAVHSIEVVGDGTRVWRIEHTLTRTEAQQARSVQYETRFELTGPGVPDAYGRRSDIEAVVTAVLDAMTATSRRACSKRTRSRGRTCARLVSE